VTSWTILDPMRPLLTLEPPPVIAPARQNTWRLKVNFLASSNNHYSLTSGKYTFLIMTSNAKNQDNASRWGDNKFHKNIICIANGPLTL
jgi:hypothetical protein